MRIISGQFCRRKLLTRSGLVTRPMADRVKESLFQRLQDLDQLAGRRVADLFAGTGTLGLEALSRDALSVVFVEHDRRAHELLERNVERLDVVDRTLCWRTDVLRCSFHPKGRHDLLPYDLIFVDPPYALVPQIRLATMLFRALRRLARPAISSNTARLVLRTPERAAWELPDDWQLDETLAIGRMELHLCRKREALT